jgi:hypothetical protein
MCHGLRVAIPAIEHHDVPPEAETVGALYFLLRIVNLFNLGSAAGLNTIAVLKLVHSNHMHACGKSSASVSPLSQPARRMRTCVVRLHAFL